MKITYKLTVVLSVEADSEESAENKLEEMDYLFTDPENGKIIDSEITEWEKVES